MSQLLDKIIEAKDKLGDKQAEIIAEGYPLEQWNPERGSAKSIFNPNDNTPSMMWEKRNYYFKDFSTGKVFGILDYYMQHYNEPYLKAVKRLLDETNTEYDPSLFNFSQTSESKDYFKNYVYPREEPPANDAVIAYMARRGISEKTCRYVGLGSDIHNNVAYNVRDINGKVTVVKYRPSHAIRQGEAKYFYQKNASVAPVLYNVDKVDPTKPLTICEGYNDCLACIEAGYVNVVSIPSGAEDLNWVELNFELLDQCEELILWYDNDEAGQEGLKKVTQRLGEYRCKIVKPTEEDEEAVRSYYQNVTNNPSLDIHKTDANNVLLACGAARILSLINNAEEIPLESVIDLMTAEPFDIGKVNYIPSGIADLDRQIYGYIDGTFSIFTAYAGCGKTTLLSQSCVLEAVDKGESVFWFNSESSTASMLSWILQQAASRKHCVEYTNQNGFKYYKPTPQATEAIKKAYSKKIFVYDNLLLSNPEQVLDKMKAIYRKRGTKVFIVDNWMCLNFRGISEQDIAGAQVEFLNKLIHFTKQNGLEVSVVCHPKKPSAVEPLNQYSLLGSSNITNLADRIYGLEKIISPELRDGGYDRQITVFKDRILGVQGAKVGLYYDRVTRRLYSDSDDRDKAYSWDDGSIRYSSPNFGTNGLLVGDRVLDIDRRAEENMPY